MGLQIEDNLRDLHEVYSVKFVVVGQVFCGRLVDAVEFNPKVGKLHQHLKFILEDLPYCYCWKHRGFWNCKCNLYLSNGVHLNNLGNYKFMWSIRGAILKAVSLVGASVD